MIDINNIEHTIHSKVYKGRTDIIYTYEFKCITIDCLNKCRVQKHHIKKSKGLCKQCVQRGIPFKARYNELIKSNSSRKHTIDLTFDEFLEFTKINKCHYCNINIIWEPYTRNKQNTFTRKYQLDRKNNDLGYSKNNCVVCCTKCNYAKGDRYSYIEWYGMTEYLRKNNKY